MEEIAVRISLLWEMIIQKKHVSQINGRQDMRELLENMEQCLQKRHKAEVFTEWQRRTGTPTVEKWHASVGRSSDHKKQFPGVYNMSSRLYVTKVLQVEARSIIDEMNDIKHGLRYLFLELQLGRRMSTKGKGLPWFSSISKIRLDTKLVSIPQLVDQLLGFSSKVYLPPTEINADTFQVSMFSAIWRIARWNFCSENLVKLQNHLKTFK